MVIEEKPAGGAAGTGLSCAAGIEGTDAVDETIPSLTRASLGEAAGALGAKQPHQDEVFPAVRVKLGVTADAFLAETAG